MRFDRKCQTAAPLKRQPLHLRAGHGGAAATSAPGRALVQGVGNRATQALGAGLQCKPAVSAPEDPLERQADVTADQIMRMSAPQASSARPVANADVGAAIQATQKSGAALPAAARSFFEPRFGRDFGDVRVHTGDDAARAASSAEARAYTIGRDIVFGAHEYAPQTTEGRRLIAHELAHVVQGAEAAPDRARKMFRKGPADESTALAKKINAAMTGVVNEGAVLQALSVVNRDFGKSEPLKAAYRKMFHKEIESDLRTRLRPDARARALFLLNGPSPAWEKSTVTVDKPGTKQLQEPVGDGEVTVHTGTDFTVHKRTDFATIDEKQKDGFSIGFSRKAGAGDSRFLQIIWAEIIVTRPGQVDLALNADLGRDEARIETTHDDYKPWTPKSKTPPNYKVDSKDIISPFYEAAYASNRDATSTTIFDAMDIPQKLVEVVGPVFDKAPGITKIVCRVHVSTYLIQEEKPIHRVSLDFEYTVTSKTKPPIAKPPVVTSATVTELPPDVKTQLVDKYSNYDWIR